MALLVHLNYPYSYNIYIDTLNGQGGRFLPHFPMINRSSLHLNSLYSLYNIYIDTLNVTEAELFLIFQ